MTDKERITEILKAYTKKHNISASSVILEEYAEELLANGVIVPPCKVGDTVYHTYYLFKELIVEELKVLELTIDNKGIRRLYGATESGSIYCFSRDYNLNEIKFTREGAEKALERSNGNA